MSVFNQIGGGGGIDSNNAEWVSYLIRWVWNSSSKKFNANFTGLPSMPLAGAGVYPGGELYFIGDNVTTSSSSTYTLESFARTDTGFEATVAYIGSGANASMRIYFLIERE